MVFDLQSGVIRFSCLASLRPLHAFTARVSAIVIAGLIILLAHLFFQRCKPVDFQHSAPLKNSLGLVFLSFYIGVARATLVPLECYDHVAEDRASIVAFPQVLCGSPEHGQMQAVAACAIVCFPVGLCYLICCDYGFILSKLHLRLAWMAMYPGTMKLDNVDVEDGVFDSQYRRMSGSISHDYLSQPNFNRLPKL